MSTSTTCLPGRAFTTLPSTGFPSTVILLTPFDLPFGFFTGKLAVTQFAPYGVLLHRLRQAGVYLQSVIGRAYAKYILGDGEPVPCGCTREPRVFTLSRTCGILACHHLAIDVRFYLVKRLVLYPRRAYLSVVFPSVIAAPGHSLADYNPRVVVAEDAGILLVTCRLLSTMPCSLSR